MDATKRKFLETEKRTKKVYENNAKAFDKQRNKSLFERAWLNKFISLIPKGSDVLDVGCGSGEPVAKYLIEQDLKVDGIDISSNMIGLAKQRFPTLLWQVADMRIFKLDKKFRGIIAWNSFFHLNPDGQRLAMSCFAEHLFKDGVLMMTIGHEKGEVIGSVNGEDVYHSSMTIEEYTYELDLLGLEVIEYKLKDDNCFGHSILLAKKVE